MSLNFARLFAPTVVTNVAAALFTIAAGGVLKNGRIRLVNTSGGAITVTLNISQTAPAAANCCLSAQSIASNSFLDVDIPTMIAGDKLFAVSSAASGIVAQELGGVVYS